MRHTWRWFGPKDVVSVADMCQAGVQGVVTALHHVPTGAVWAPGEIAQRQAEIAQLPGGHPSGLAWEVVESLPVSEAIKQQSGDWRADIAAYKTSLTHLADAGLEVICYNFMPVLDWTRTDLAWPRPDGATCMRFDLVDFAVFDLMLLNRPRARDSYTDAVCAAAEHRADGMSASDKSALIQNIIAGLPGATESYTLDDIRAHLSAYDGISAERLRAHLVDFLSEVVPHAEALGLRLCCHPDDPPFDLMGLPRIMSTHADYDHVLSAVVSPANGVTFCTGSLGAIGSNDLPAMAQALAERIHFLHLRNVTREAQEGPGAFFEDRHLEGNTDMVAVIAAILREEARRRATGRADAVIPMRPDHGQNILDDLTRQTQPGYPAIGRLKGLAELRGIEAALSHPAFGVSAQLS